MSANSSIIQVNQPDLCSGKDVIGDIFICSPEKNSAVSLRESPKQSSYMTMVPAHVSNLQVDQMHQCSGKDLSEDISICSPEKPTSAQTFPKKAVTICPVFILM